MIGNKWINISSLFIICAVIFSAIPSATVTAAFPLLTFDALKVESTVLGITSDITYKGLSDGSIRCFVKAINDSFNDVSVRLVVSFFEDDILLNIVISDVYYIHKNTSMDLSSPSIEINDTTEKSCLKIFVWNDMNSLQPYVPISMLMAEPYSIWPISEDTYVRNGTYAELNFGGETGLFVKKTVDNNIEEERVTFLKADFAEKNDSIFTSSVLYFHVDNIISNNPSNPGKTYKIIGYAHNDWQESSVSWNNQPDDTDSTVLGFVHVSDIGWHSLDVTSFINRRVVDMVATFKIEQETEGGDLIEISSSEALDNKPHIRFYAGLKPEPGMTRQPFTTIQAEHGSYTGKRLYSIQQGEIAYEASGRACIALTNQGENVSVTSPVNGNKLTVRYSLLPLDNESLITGTLSLYVNGVHKRHLNLTNRRMLESKTVVPNGFVRFWDEITIDITINKNDTIMLQKDAGDLLSNYFIDFFEVEETPPPIEKPDSTWLSIVEYGAVPNDLIADTTAIRNCITAANNGNKKVWIPEGEFYIDDMITVPPDIQIQGAGSWHSVINKNIPAASVKKAFTLSNGNTLKNFRIVDIQGNRRINGHEGIRLASNCTIEGITVENTFGAGIIGFNCNNVTIRNCRIYGTYADGIHLARNSMFSTIEENYLRNIGDDGIALIAYGNENNRNNMVRKNTVECGYWGRGCTIQGGKFNTMELNRVVDEAHSSGLLVVVENYSGNEPNLFCYDFLIQDNTVVRSGMRGHPLYGAIWVWGRIDKPMSGDVQYNRIISTIRNGITVSYYVSNNVRIRYNTIDSPEVAGGHHIYTELISGYSPVICDNIYR